MSLSAGEQQALNSIESGLAGSDPGLVSLLAAFARLTSGEQMPVHEEIRVLRRRATRRPLGNRRPRRGDVHRDGRSLRLGWQQTILMLWLAVTIAMVAAAVLRDAAVDGDFLTGDAGGVGGGEVGDDTGDFFGLAEPFHGC